MQGLGCHGPGHDRSVAAFEGRTSRIEIRTQRTDDRNARIAEVEVEKRDLEERRKRLEIPAIDREMLGGLLDELAKVTAEGTNP